MNINSRSHSFQLNYSHTVLSYHALKLRLKSNFSLELQGFEMSFFCNSATWKNCKCRNACKYFFFLFPGIYFFHFSAQLWKKITSLSRLTFRKVLKVVVGIGERLSERISPSAKKEKQKKGNCTHPKTISGLP